MCLSVCLSSFMRTNSGWGTAVSTSRQPGATCDITRAEWKAAPTAYAMPVYFVLSSRSARPPLPYRPVCPIVALLSKRLPTPVPTGPTLMCDYMGNRRVVKSVIFVRRIPSRGGGTVDLSPELRNSLRGRMYSSHAMTVVFNCSELMKIGPCVHVIGLQENNR